MMLRAAAPVSTPAGRLLGVLDGGVLITRNYEIVDKIRRTVFKEEEYKGRPVGTATIFQNDVRVSTNVRSADGTRAIGTQASAEVADAVLSRGETWRGRAFVVQDWYLAAYAPIRDFSGATVGMLYVGVLERPFTDSLLAQPAGLPRHRGRRRGAGLPGGRCGSPGGFRSRSGA